MGIDRRLEDVVETVKAARARGRSCALLVGAGCSVKAEVPTAAGFVELIRKHHPLAYERAKEKTYPKCMAELAVAERRDLIASFVDKARINWAHVGIAQLIKEGYVDRVLTTNFDMLLQRSCALTGIFPSVYDFAASQLFSPADVSNPAIFHLHGQRTGFVLLHTEEEVRRHYDLLKNVFTDADRGRVWLVVGYSGENDPVFDHIASIPRFDNNLYWIGYRDNVAAPHVRDRLLVEGKYAFFIGGHDADDFFVRLTQKLECFPPPFVSRPFSHIEKLLSMLTPYTIPGDSAAIDVTSQTRDWIRKAVQEHEECLAFTRLPKFNLLAAQRALMAGRYADVVVMYESNPESAPEEARDIVCCAYVALGNSFAADAKRHMGAGQNDLFQIAYDRFARAAAIPPARTEVLNAWGAVLLAHAEVMPEHAISLIRESIKKHEAALEIDAEDAWTLNNLGNAQFALGMALPREEATGIINQALSQFRRAIERDPQKHVVLNSWGSALARYALRLDCSQTLQLLDESAAKYRDALKIKPDDHWAMNHLASVLMEKSFRSTPPESESLSEEALQWYERATQLRAERHWSLHNWGNALIAQAKRKSGDEAERLFAMAERNYQAALDHKPDYFWALNSWGFALYERALTLSGSAAEQEFARAGQKFYQALLVNPYDSWALNNWGNVLSHEATFKDDHEALRLLQLAEQQFQAALAVNPADRWTYTHWSESLIRHAARYSGHEKNGRLELAKTKLETAESLEPGCATFRLAQLAAQLGQLDECRRWLERCRELKNLPADESFRQDVAFVQLQSQPWFTELAGEQNRTQPAISVE